MPEYDLALSRMSQAATQRCTVGFVIVLSDLSISTPFLCSHVSHFSFAPLDRLVYSKIKVVVVHIFELDCGYNKSHRDDPERLLM